MKLRPAVTLAALLALTSAPSVHAETIIGKSSLVMGDNDSRSDARSLCYLGAKKRALEQAGVYIQAQTRVENLQLKSEEVTAFTAAIAKIEETGHSFAVSGDQQTVNCTVRVTVDPAEMKRRLTEYAKDGSLRSQFTQQQRRVEELENRITTLSRALTGADIDKAATTRRERQEAFADMRAIEAAVTAWTGREDRLQHLKRLATQYLKTGMTRSEVAAILGKPDRYNSGSFDSSWSYGPSVRALVIRFDSVGTNSGLSGDGYVREIYGLEKPTR